MFDGKGIGLPYNFKFGDLKAPWYSGMTQGFALSYLLRYYSLTDDESILPITKKIAYVMLAPQKLGGTISTTKEGCTWIEEYPNSKRSKQVLNGFINGLIGLYEYSNFFTDDIRARQIFVETYECLKSSLEYYDTPTWSTYNRNNKSITNRYLRYQIFEMKQLFELFQDSIFDSQMRIWSVLTYNKFIKGKSLGDKFMNYNFSRPVQKMNDSLYFIPLNPKQLVKTDSIEIHSFNSKRGYKRFSKGKNKKSNNKYSNLSISTFAPASPKKIDYAEITFKDSTIFQYEISAYDNSEKKLKRLVEISIDKYCKGNQLFLSFPEINISDLFIKIEKKNKSNLSISDINFYNTSSDKPISFAHFISQTIQIEKESTYEINLPLIDTDKAVLFYKYSTSNKKLKYAKWKAINTLDINENFTPSRSGKYIFMIVYDWNNPLSFIGHLSITPL